MGKKPEDLLSIEKAFREIKEKKNIQFNLRLIERILSRAFDIKFEISIVNNDTNEFYGMCIYPQMSTIDRLLIEILEGKNKSNTIYEIWQENKLWTLEIDSIILFDKNLNANPSEITAALLHEIGHVVSSNKIPGRVYRILKYELMKLDYSMKQLIKNPKVRSILGLTIIEACSSKNFKFLSVDSEAVADKFVVKLDYGDELNQLLDKIIKSRGNRLIDRTENEMDSDVKSIVNWSVENISELMYRKTKLKSSLQTILLQNPSNFVKKMVHNIKNTFFGDSEDRYKSALMEQCLFDICKKVVHESFMDLFDKIGKLKKISQSEIDVIGIEIEKIENNDDKIYVLDLIYDKLDLINTALDYIDTGKKDKVQQSKATLQGMKKQLETFRSTILSIQIKDKQYGVFIKYPKGYEG